MCLWRFQGINRVGGGIDAQGPDLSPKKRSADVHFSLRMDETLRRRLERAAKEGRRSINQEIIVRLERSFTFDDNAVATVAKEGTWNTAELERVASGLSEAARTVEKAVKQAKARERKGHESTKR